MRQFLMRRLPITLLVLLGVTLGAFIMLHLAPGDPVLLLVGENLQSGTDSAEAIQQIRARLGLDEPLPIQYLRFLAGVLHGDLGQSIFQKRPVLNIILEQFPNTAQLALFAILIAVSVGMTAGILAARSYNSWFDSMSMMVALFGVSMPGFWLGLMLMLLFAVGLGWLPTSGQGTIWHLILPATTLGLGHAAILARLTRSSMLEVLHQEYMTTARGKGLREHVVLLHHGLRNAAIPVITIIGLQFGHMLAGAFVIEIVFARQGLGSVLVTAILNRDFPVAQGTILFTAVFYVLTNLLVDLSYPFLDPRVSHGLSER
jgi:peptide/nickel transport system permease protein